LPFAITYANYILTWFKLIDNYQEIGRMNKGVSRRE
jgi:hypothetical protein